MGAPSRSPMATLMVLSSMRNPSVEIGKTFSHAPDSLAFEASRRARDLGSGAALSRDSARAVALGLSHAFYRCFSSSSGGVCP